MHGTNYLIQQQKSVASQKNHVLLEKIRLKQSTSLQPTITKRKKRSESLIYHGAEHLVQDINRNEETNAELRPCYTTSLSRTRGMVENILLLLERILRWFWAICQASSSTRVCGMISTHGSIVRSTEKQSWMYLKYLRDKLEKYIMLLTIKV